MAIQFYKTKDSHMGMWRDAGQGRTLARPVGDFTKVTIDERGGDFKLEVAGGCRAAGGIKYARNQQHVLERLPFY